MAAPQIVPQPFKRRWGYDASGGSVPVGICGGVQLGINRNKPMYAGRVQWFDWVRWEAVDAGRYPDPYGYLQLIGS